MSKTLKFTVDTVSPEGLQKYAEFAGLWRTTGTGQPFVEGESWTIPGGMFYGNGTDVNILLPTDKKYGDYEMRAMQALEVLTEITGHAKIVQDEASARFYNLVGTSILTQLD